VNKFRSADGYRIAVFRLTGSTRTVAFGLSRGAATLLPASPGPGEAADRPRRLRLGCFALDLVHRENVGAERLVGSALLMVQKEQSWLRGEQGRLRDMSPGEGGGTEKKNAPSPLNAQNALIWLRL
jgi:hypothetical protein